MPAMTEVVCACGCGRSRLVRTSEIKRGWGKYFGKSCKARHQVYLRKQPPETS